MRWILQVGEVIFRAALGIRLLAAAVVRAPPLSALALAAALLAIPVGEARAHDDTSATLHAETYPLNSAAGWGDLDSVNHFLIDHMATVNMRGNFGWTPLHSAARFGHGSIVSVLLVAGADVNTKTDNSGNTPLHFAASYRAVSVVSALIAAGADVNVKNHRGSTPLHSAVSARDFSMASTLIAAGADVNAKDNYGETPLRGTCYSSSNGNILCPAFAALRRVLIAAGGHWGEACANAAVVNPAGLIPPCLCESPNVETPGDCAVPSAEVCGGLTPAKFYSATVGACVAVASCAAPAVRNAGTNRCDCPAPNVGTDGADAPGDCTAPSAESCGGLTPAKFYDSAAGECVAFAICATPATLNAGTNRCDCPAPNIGTDGADAPGDCAAPSAQVCGGLTPAQFYSATLSVCVPFVECATPSVLNAGVNLCDCPAPNAGTDGADAPGNCAAASAESCGGLTPAKFYDSAAGECVAFAICATPATLNAGMNLCDCPAPNIGVDGADAPGDCHAENALHQAASIGDVDSVNHLISIHMADVNAKGDDGKTPLHWAAAQGHLSIVSALIAAGADVNEKGFRGWTPLHEAAALINSSDRLSIILALIAAGADVNAKDDDGKTPLHRAARHQGLRSALIAAGGHWGEACESPEIVNPAGATPPCLCESPNVGTPGDCAAPSAQVCGGLTPAQFYAATLSACVPFVRCGTVGGTLDRKTNACEFSVESCGELNPPKFYNANAGECGAVLFPCHDSAVVKADNSGCECPAGAFAHGDPSGGRWDDNCQHSYNGSCIRHGEWRKIIPATAICHAGHAPIRHNVYGWLSAIRANNPTLIAHFISGHGQNPDDENYHLHSAAADGYHQAAKALIAGGANLDRKNGAGDAPLHPAVRNERAELITLLLQRGADADAKDDDGDTALHLAARRPDTAENAGLIAFLLDAGADPNIFNDRRWRPLDLADGRDGYPRRRKIMAALIAGGANWSDECVGGKTPNEYTPPKCKCPPHLSIDNNGLCECPAHSHSQVNGRCLPKDSAQVEAEILKMETELLRLRAALVSLNARLSAAAEMPREAVEEIAEQAGDTAQEIKRRRDNFLALARADLAGAPPPPVAMSDTAAECRMLGGEVQIHSATGIRICSGIDANDTFCLVDSGDAYPCRGLFRHVRTCNDDYNRRALNPFFCGARCGAQKAVGKDCAAP